MLRFNSIFQYNVGTIGKPISCQGTHDDTNIVVEFHFLPCYQRRQASYADTAYKQFWHAIKVIWNFPLRSRSCSNLLTISLQINKNYHISKWFLREFKYILMFFAAKIMFFAQKVVSLHRFLRKLAHFAVLHLFANKRNKKKLNIQTNGISK